jgi:hypothetical protein
LPARTALFTHAAILVAAVIVVGRLFGQFGDGVDFHAYWSVSLDSLYANSRSYAPDAFLYTPLFAQVTEPLRWLPFEVALALWTALELGCLIWLARAWSLPAMLLLAPEWMNGNVHLVMAASVVVGAWAVPAFTKASPAIGLLWYVLRGEWRYVLRTVAVLGAVAAVSFAIAPSLWFDWAAMIAANAGAPPPPGSMQVPLVLRLAVAVLILLWAARTGRQWPIPLACAFGLPVLWWAGLMAFGMAALRSRLDRHHSRSPRPVRAVLEDDPVGIPGAAGAAERPLVGVAPR